MPVQCDHCGRPHCGRLAMHDLIKAHGPRAELSEDLPVKWHRLITEMEDFTARTGWGLASVWGFVWVENYERAVATFKEIRQFEAARQARSR